MRKKVHYVDEVFPGAGGSWAVSFYKNLHGIEYDVHLLAANEQDAHDPRHVELAEIAFRRAERRDFCSWGWAG